MKDDSTPEEENRQHEIYDNIFIPPPINCSKDDSLYSCNYRKKLSHSQANKKQGE